MLLVFNIIACKYDDGDLWNKVNSLDKRVTSIEDQLKTMNSDISALQKLANALQNNVYVESVEHTNNGYTITFTDGSKATISNGINGSNGSNGKDAPIIGIGELESKYYWTQTIGNTTSWIIDTSGNRIPVTGADAITPQLEVDESGYWLISYDKGMTFINLLDKTGNPVKAVGKDGSDGADGNDGVKGDSFFKSVKVENGELILILGDGTELKIALANSDKELPEYIALNQSLGNEVDFAILGMDGSGYFYEFQDEDPNIPKRLSIYDGLEEKIKLVINFDSEGLPKNILSDEFTIVLGKYIENKFNAVAITKEGESAIYENVEADLFWDEYKHGVSNPDMTRAVSRSPIKWVNAVVGGVGCGLSIASTIVTAPTGVGAVIGWGLTTINCTSAIMSIADAAGWIDIPVGSAVANTTIGHYANLASCIGIVGGVGVASCLTGLVNNVTAIGDLINDLANDDIALGEGSLISGNGEVKITLTWNNYADIDLHCIDPTGYHIYYANKTSTSGGFLDYDNTVAYGPENIYFNPAPEGAYHAYLHYYAENKGVSSVNYKVVIFINGYGQTYEGTISGQGSVVDISTFLIGTISNRKATYAPINWENLPNKKYYN